LPIKNSPKTHQTQYYQGDSLPKITFLGLNSGLSERDILTRVVAEEKNPRQVSVADAMTSDVVVVSPDTSIEDASSIMQSRRVRHLPVCNSEGRLLGLISIGDINARHVSDQEVTIMHLHEYLYGRV
jgi:signal-transduction protein with cAMP-binding, CBS, and nucleotidyltransferase domain